MDTRRSATAITDDALDREVARALAVDTSPEFLARVRTRVAREPAPHTWRMSWATCFAGGAVVAAAIVFAVALTRTNRTTRFVPRQSLAARDVTIGSATLPRVASGFSRTNDQPTAPPSTRSGRAETRIARGEPVEPRARVVEDSKPLFDPREARALQALIAGLRSGRVDLSPLLKPAGPPPMELPPIDDLSISPITIDLIAPIDGAQGVRQ
jgi:hypothetical protein